MASKFTQLTNNKSIYNRKTIRRKLRIREQRYNDYFRSENLFLRKK